MRFTEIFSFTRDSSCSSVVVLSTVDHGAVHISGTVHSGFTAADRYEQAPQTRGHLVLISGTQCSPAPRAVVTHGPAISGTFSPTAVTLSPSRHSAV